MKDYLSIILTLVGFATSVAALVFYNKKYIGLTLCQAVDDNKHCKMSYNSLIFLCIVYAISCLLFVLSPKGNTMYKKSVTMIMVALLAIGSLLVLVTLHKFAELKKVIRKTQTHESVFNIALSLGYASGLVGCVSVLSSVAGIVLSK